MTMSQRAMPGHPGPRILLAATTRWSATARLAKALLAAGCDVAVVCPRQHPVTTIRHAPTAYRYHALTPLRSLRAALDAARPDVVIPCDDLATAHLVRLYDEAVAGGQASEGRRALLETSLGEPGGMQVAATRSRCMAFAHERGIRVPPTAVVHTEPELVDWLARHGCPAVLKTDGSYGGRGVRIIDSMAEASRVWHALSTPPSPARAVKRAIVNRDTTYLLPCLQRTRPVVNVQAFVAGQDANCTVACWKGKILASIGACVLKTLDALGPSSVLRVVDHREMFAAVEELVGQLRLSGLIGFDFLLEKGTGDAYLIEVNPRAPQVGHLQLGPGRDLVGAIRAAVSGEVPRTVAPVTDRDVIALFPQEWLRDPTSDYLKTAYHDVPWDEPELIRACVNPTFVHRAWTGLSHVGHEAKLKLAARSTISLCRRGS